MPYALSLVQQEMGFKGFGRGITKRQKRERKPNSWETIDPSLERLHSVFIEWQQSIGDPTLLVAVSCVVLLCLYCIRSWSLTQHIWPCANSDRSVDRARRNVKRRRRIANVRRLEMTRETMMRSGTLISVELGGNYYPQEHTLHGNTMRKGDRYLEQHGLFDAFYDGIATD